MAKKYPDRHPWSRVSLMEQRFYFGLRTRDKDVAAKLIEFGNELSLASATPEKWVQNFFLRLAETIAKQPQDRADHFRRSFERAIKARKPHAK